MTCNSLGRKSQERDASPMEGPQKSCSLPTVTKQHHPISREATTGAKTMTTHHGILLHVVFSTKYRKPLLLDDWRDDLYAYIGGIVKDHKSTLLKSGGIEDHVHLFLRIHPEFAVSKTIQLLKANSSKWINDHAYEEFTFDGCYRSARCIYHD